MRAMSGAPDEPRTTAAESPVTEAIPEKDPLHELPAASPGPGVSASAPTPVLVEEELPATTGKTALSPEERAELEARFRREVEQDHAQRLERLHRKQETARSNREERLARARQREMSLLRDEVRMRFYKENGYQRIEENGRERWLPPEEYASRQRARARANTRAVGSRVHTKYKMVPLYLLLALIAMAIGAFLVR